MLRDAERAGEAGGADAANGDPAALRQRRDLVVLELRGRPQACVDGIDRVARQRGHQRHCLVDQAAQSCLVYRGVVALLRFLRSGANQHVAEGGPGQHDALGALIGDRQDDRPHQPVGRLVEHHELAFARTDGER